jgi:hypothetical protein
MRTLDAEGDDTHDESQAFGMFLSLLRTFITSGALGRDN